MDTASAQELVHHSLGLNSDRLRARRTFEGANLIFHVIEDDAWPFESQQTHADAWTAWLDLADAEDRAADPLLDRLVGGRVRD